MCPAQSASVAHVGKVFHCASSVLVCPADIAYGERGQRQIPPGSTLDFEVQLISIAPRPQAMDGDGGAAATAPTANANESHATH
jgi:hypothetical protein